MLTFGTLWDTHEVFRFGRSEADAITLDGLVEGPRRDYDGSFQQASILHLLEPLDVLANDEGKLKKKYRQPGP
jgi:hypothetical protein